MLKNIKHCASLFDAEQFSSDKVGAAVLIYQGSVARAEIGGGTPCGEGGRFDRHSGLVRRGIGEGRAGGGKVEPVAHVPRIGNAPGGRAVVHRKFSVLSVVQAFPL